MKRVIIGSLLSMFLVSPLGCTAPSTIMAQNGSMRAQEVNDGIHQDMYTALSRENFEVVKLRILMSVEKMKAGKTAEEQAELDKGGADMITALKVFAMKRDAMTDWDRDHERSNSYKYVTVDAKLFSEQGVLNYLADRISGGTQKVLHAYDQATQPTK